MAIDQMAFTEKELRKSQKRYQDAKLSLMAFQNRYNIVDPVTQAQSTEGIAMEIASAISRKEAELKNFLSYLQTDAYRVVALRNEIIALKSQLEEEKLKLAAPSGEKLNVIISEYQNLILSMAFAEESYKATLATTEKVRIDASRKVKNLAIIQSPFLPEMAIYPRKMLVLLELAILFLLTYGIIRFIIMIINDHKES